MESEEVKRIECCRLCGGKELIPVVTLGPLYISDFPRRTQAKHAPVEMSVVQCRDCELVQLEYTAPRDWMYRDYYYRSGLNESMVKALQDVKDSAMQWTWVDPKKDTVIDIGANDGTLLKMWKGQAANRIAFEPALNLGKELAQNCEMMVPDFFGSPNCYNGEKAKVITSIAMFYDLEDPVGFVKEIAKALAYNGVWIVQFTDLRAMVEVNAWDSFCHEHLCYFSVKTFMKVLELAGTDLQVVDIERNEVNGGSVRYYLMHDGKVADADYVDPTDPIGSFRRLQSEFSSDNAVTATKLKKFVEAMQECRNKVTDYLHELLEDPKNSVDVLGASTKGNTLLQYFGLDSRYIRRAIDRNEDKVGRFTVGTWIPIVGEQEGRVYPAKVLVALPWHFKEGLVKRERRYLDLGGKILFPMPKPTVVSKDGEVEL